jgi:RNA polymerase sigma-70 factor (ECF subfamily)
MEERRNREAGDELALARRAATGDQRAFAQIVTLYERRLLVYLTQMLNDAETARDMAQETFIAAFQALPRWQPPDPLPVHPLSPWLYRIATNRALSHLRAQQHDAGDVAVRWRQDQAQAHEGTLEDRTAARDLLETALRQLSEEDAACLVLHYVAGERYHEIGSRLGISSDAVRKRVGRALTALRAAYHALDVEAKV